MPHSSVFETLVGVHAQALYEGLRNIVYPKIKYWKLHELHQKIENLEYWVAPETYFKSIFKFGRGKLNFVG